MEFKKSLIILASLLAVACAPEKKSSVKNPNMNTQGVTSSAPRQSYVVRVNNQTGQAEYANADFTNSTDQNQLAQMTPSLQQWQPIEQNQVISKQTGFPQAKDGSTYFVQDPANFNVPDANNMANSQAYPSQLPAGSNGVMNGSSPTMPTTNSAYYYYPYYPYYGYYYYPYYGGYTYPYYHNYYYPATGYYPYGCGYTCYYYQPTYYYNTYWTYWNPYYYMPYGGYTYYYYSFWW